MAPWTWLVEALLLLPLVVSEPIPLSGSERRLTPVPKPDPCIKVAGKTWVLPSEARECLRSFPLKPEIKANILEIVTKTLAFHASTNYQIQAPPPYHNDVHHDLHRDLERIEKTEYESEFDFHVDVYTSFKKVNDGHCGVYNRCFDSLWVTYLPLPLSLLSEEDGSQNIHVSPEAFTLASAEFADSLQWWQDALPSDLKGRLAELSGARVLQINGKDPWEAVNANTLVAGGYQAFATRQNGFFSSYHRGASGWEYSMGNFATLVHPLVDSVNLTLSLPSEPSTNYTVTIPYRSRFGSASKNFTDGDSLRANNCIATLSTNGVDLYAGPVPPDDLLEMLEANPPSVGLYQQQPQLSPFDILQRHPLNVILDAVPLGDIDLPETMQPGLTPLNSSYSVAEFYMLQDNKTAVLALGSFSAKNFTRFGESLLNGLLELKEAGAKRLVVDVTNNGGGYICMAHWLHRLIIGPKSTTEPQAGLDTTLRVGPLAQLVSEAIANGSDPSVLLYYNSAQWTNETHQKFPETSSDEPNWLNPRKLVVNGKDDMFSARLGQECQPFQWEAPDYGLFKAGEVVIVSNGRCASSCSLFSITMAKEEGVRTVVVGGKSDMQQHYCGIVGGQSTDFSTIDTEIKSTKLKGHPLSPPDFVTNSIQGITWRLGYGIDDPTEPEEWQDHSADVNFAVTKETVNKPHAIWEAVVKSIWKEEKELDTTPTQAVFELSNRH